VAKPLTLESIETNGNTRTSTAVIQRYLGLTPGDTFNQDDLLAAINRLRRSELFVSVDFFTRPGQQRGALVLILDVVERNIEFRLGTGNTDLNGWYLIPASLSFNNLTGHGENAALRLYFGYRTFGVTAHYRRGTAPGDRTFWGAEAQVLGQNRVYFLDGVEYIHPLATGTFDLHLGRRLSNAWSLELGLSAESVDADSTGSVHMDDEFRGLEVGDEVPFAELPPSIAAAVGERERSIWRLDLVLDTRHAKTRADSPVSGLWGRLRTQYTLGKDADYPAASCDLRAYQSVGEGVLALRTRAAVVGDGAPFYDRQYLGGLYTVRGFPSQSLSAPAGDDWIWHSSLEYRAALLGDPANPRVTGALFVDTGRSRNSAGMTNDVAVGAGWGFRIRLGWLGYFGVDLAFPLTDSPIDESVHGHASLGWSF
jgi:outer membrane protein assembly factor BamA